jgi:hypothetical protein
MKKTIELGAKVAERGLEILAREGGDPGDYRTLARAYERAYAELAPTTSEEIEERPAGEEIAARAERILAAERKELTYENLAAAMCRAEEELRGRTVRTASSGDPLLDEIRAARRDAEALCARVVPDREFVTASAENTIRALREF